MISSVKDANYFIGTTHSCLLLDQRSGFVQKWTHMLPQTPTVGHATWIELERFQNRFCFYRVYLFLT